MEGAVRNTVKGKLSYVLIALPVLASSPVIAEAAVADPTPAGSPQVLGPRTIHPRVMGRGLLLKRVLVRCPSISPQGCRVHVKPRSLRMSGGPGIRTAEFKLPAGRSSRVRLPFPRGAKRIRRLRRSKARDRMRARIRITAWDGYGAQATRTFTAIVGRAKHPRSNRERRDASGRPRPRRGPRSNTRKPASPREGAAEPPLTIGISDQSPATFANPLFTSLGIRNARLVAPWNAVITEPERLHRWLSAAQAANIEPLVVFEHARNDRCPDSPCRLPSPAAYGAALREFQSQYPWVQLITPWNEPNHPSQPTAYEPVAAAALYNEARAACPRCRLVAGDVLDDSSMEAWVTKYKNALMERPALWGLHNYYDVTRFGTDRTSAFLGLVQGDVWLTEAGGIVYRRAVDGRVVHPYDEARAERSLSLGFDIARRFGSRIPRVYVYQWQSPPNARFDAGLLGPDGNPRPTYHVFRREAARRSAADRALPAERETHARTNMRIVLSHVRLSRRAKLTVPVACLSNAVVEHCAGRVSIESARYRRSRLVNGEPREHVLQPRRRRMRLTRSSTRNVTFHLPRSVLENLARGRFRITLEETVGENSRTSSHVVALSARR